jgi:hypothetical protein
MIAQLLLSDNQLQIQLLNQLNVIISLVHQYFSYVPKHKARNLIIIFIRYDKNSFSNIISSFYIQPHI